MAMTYHRSKIGKGDDTRINVGQTHEINYWTRQLNTSPDRLKKAVAAVGPLAKDVKKWLNSNH
jgi:hypothetical protein